MHTSSQKIPKSQSQSQKIPKNPKNFGMNWDHPRNSGNFWDCLGSSPKTKFIPKIPNFSVALGFFGIHLGSKKKIGITPRSSQKIWGRLGSSEARVITAFLLFEKGSFHLCDPVTLHSHGNWNDYISKGTVRDLQSRFVTRNGAGCWWLPMIFFLVLTELLVQWTTMISWRNRLKPVHHIRKVFQEKGRRQTLAACISKPSPWFW